MTCGKHHADQESKICTGKRALKLKTRNGQIFRKTPKHYGAPPAGSERTEETMNARKTNVMRLLDNAGIKYQMFEYPVDDGLIDAVSIARKIGRDAEEVFKTLVTVSSSGEHFVFVVPANGELDLKKAAKASGQKSIEMLPSRQLLPLTGYVHGGCSPVGMKKPFRTWIDETAILYDTICVSGGKIGTNLAVNPETLAAFLPAEFADLAKE